MTKIIDGKKISGLIASRLDRKIRGLKIKPKLVIIQVGSLAESTRYIKRKKIFAEKIGVTVLHKTYPNSVREKRILDDISKYNRDKLIHGIMIQLPVPKHLDTINILESIKPIKDIDGLGSRNTKIFLDNKKGFIPAVARGIMTLLDNQKIKLVGKKVVMVGQSSLVGRPIALALLNKGATVTICHKETRNLDKETRSADILIVATGHSKLITAKYTNRQQIIIDVGISIKDGKAVGDVDFSKVSKVVRAITPVPGGVGPMTVASLFENLLEAYYLQT